MKHAKIDNLSSLDIIERTAEWALVTGELLLWKEVEKKDFCITFHTTTARDKQIIHKFKYNYILSWLVEFKKHNIWNFPAQQHIVYKVAIEICKPLRDLLFVSKTTKRLVQPFLNEIRSFCYVVIAYQSVNKKFTLPFDVPYPTSHDEAIAKKRKYIQELHNVFE